MSRPPSQAVIEAVEQAERDHGMASLYGTFMLRFAGAYQQEGPMTTFFRLEGDRQVVDCWSTRMASFRTADIVIIRRRETDEPVRIGTHLEAAS